ncbi:hypothetical protein AV530_003737 [Patagioenas fasciata monilis]|uniref:Uncharacterized protein n=1 Tax=Patagioenas fasciata monilis TaxID=372326 RepID=A0A1V4KZ43_PATFA|nr:hypothetical protein AV530_003737 [Patagioenas fasciata monilis]
MKSLCRTWQNVDLTTNNLFSLFWSGVLYWGSSFAEEHVPVGDHSFTPWNTQKRNHPEEPSLKEERGHLVLNCRLLQKIIWKESH